MEVALSVSKVTKECLRKKVIVVSIQVKKNTSQRMSFSRHIIIIKLSMMK
jgi:hypothetical protein